MASINGYIKAYQILNGSEVLVVRGNDRLSAFLFTFSSPSLVLKNQAILKKSFDKMLRGKCPGIEEISLEDLLQGEHGAFVRSTLEGVQWLQS